MKPRVGDRVRITGPMDDPDPIPVGTEGTVDWVNTWTSELTRQIGVRWDNGRKLLLLDTDPFTIIQRKGKAMNEMRSAAALETLIDITRWAENAEEVLPRRIQSSDSDADCAALADQTGGEFETDDVTLIRDAWRAVEHAQAMLAQRGCETFDPAVQDGKLTDLIDIIIFG